MSVLEYSVLISELFKIVKKALQRRKASEEEIKELQTKLFDVVRLAHDTAVDVLSYINPINTAVAASVHAEEIQRMIRQQSDKSMNDAIEESLWTLRERTDRTLKANIMNIHRFRSDYESSIEYQTRAQKHVAEAYTSFKKNQRTSLDDLKAAEEELDALINFLLRRMEEQLRPLVDTYTKLAEGKRQT